MSGADLPPVPSVEQYREALRSLRARNAVPPAYWKMLAAHYRAPHHAITAEGLAQAAGYKNSRGANLHYGRFGKLLRDELNYREQGVELYVLSALAPPGLMGNSQWLLIMHPEVAAALEAEPYLLSE
jgi:hypothetical protein